MTKCTPYSAAVQANCSVGVNEGLLEISRSTIKICNIYDVISTLPESFLVKMSPSVSLYETWGLKELLPPCFLGQLAD